MTMRQGGCRCGQVRFTIDSPPILAMACHCTGCQRMSGSAFSLSVVVPGRSLAVTQGEPVVGGLHGASRHYFCAYCMSWLFTRPNGIEAFVTVRPTMLDEPGWFTPFVETWTSEKLPWATTPAVHSFEKFPKPEAYEALTLDYAGWSGYPA